MIEASILTENDIWQLNTDTIAPSTVKKEVRSRYDKLIKQRIVRIHYKYA